ncbi:MAG: RpiB/LacA/LacB family sugar-phosphate isomerase [Blautia massiliensis (ex Durand et al. 2017)]|uniref:RpiB/LacA/LacB family sugar-phosphate isomerase n=1 Tax=Subdoligranulum variabile TaxID=214851 RepID=UPI00397F0437
MAHLQDRRLECQDFGCEFNASLDYPVYGKVVAHAVASGECEKGIVICSTGIGIPIAANKIPSIHCALYRDCFSAKGTRLHNNENVLDPGVLFTGMGLDIVDLFIDTPFSGEECHCYCIIQLEEQ